MVEFFANGETRNLVEGKNNEWMTTRTALNPSQGNNQPISYIHPCIIKSFTGKRKEIQHNS
jgi:hypothetical protein